MLKLALTWANIAWHTSLVVLGRTILPTKERPALSTDPILATEFFATYVPIAVDADDWELVRDFTYEAVTATYP